MTLSAPIRNTRLRMALVIFALATALGACAGKPATVVDDAAPPAPRPIGGDRDAHACLPAAGYTWCEREKRCVRPWELANEAGFENTADGFARPCAAAPTQPAR
jgi:hypothetical protein